MMHFNEAFRTITPFDKSISTNLSIFVSRVIVLFLIFLCFIVLSLGIVFILKLPVNLHDVYDAIHNATDITPEKIILLSINFLFGFMGVFINFAYELYKIRGFKLKKGLFIKNNFNFLLFWCCIGGTISMFIVPLKAYICAIFTGFGFMSILEQISTGKKSLALFEGYSSGITNKALTESDKSLDKQFEKLRKLKVVGYN